MASPCAPTLREMRLEHLRGRVGISASLMTSPGVGNGQRSPRFTQGAKYGNPDFNLRDGDLRIPFDGCRYEIVAENEIMINVTAEDFRLSVLGFDGRDVIVQFNPTNLAGATGEGSL